MKTTVQIFLPTEQNRVENNNSNLRRNFLIFFSFIFLLFRIFLSYFHKYTHILAMISHHFLSFNHRNQLIFVHFMKTHKTPHITSLIKLYSVYKANNQCHYRKSYIHFFACIIKLYQIKYIQHPILNLYYIDYTTQAHGSLPSLSSLCQLVEGEFEFGGVVGIDLI